MKPLVIIKPGRNRRNRQALTVIGRKVRWTGRVGQTIQVITGVIGISRLNKPPKLVGRGEWMLGALQH